VYFIKQDYNQSIRSYQTVVQKFYRQEIYSKAMYKLGRTLVIAGRYKDGMALLSDYISQYSNKDYLADSSLYWTARGYIGAGDFQTALKTFNFILEKYPSTGLSYEIRSSINKLTKYLETQNSQSSQTNNLLTPDSGKLSNAAAIRQQTGQLEDEKVMLEKISRILQIKQRLLDIKAEKVEILSRLRQQNESKQ
jgi:tetratricopeptide (TPR) repeat protein